MKERNAPAADRGRTRPKPAPWPALRFPHAKKALAGILTSALSLFALATPPAGNFEQLHYQTGFANRYFGDIAAFSNDVKALKPPFQMLFENMGPDGQSGYVRFEYKPSEIQNVNVLQEAGKTAIVEADASRNHDFCAVVFLLEKDADGWQVSDMIRRCDWGSGTFFSKADILPLAPRNLVHLHIAVGRGGRLDGWDEDEFFIVKEGRFKRTLALTTGCYFRGGRYGEYSQTSKALAKDGKLRLEIGRSYRKLKAVKEEKEHFEILFRWNAAAERFTSSGTDRLGFPEH